MGEKKPTNCILTEEHLNSISEQEVWNLVRSYLELVVQTSNKEEKKSGQCFLFILEKFKRKEFVQCSCEFLSSICDRNPVNAVEIVNTIEVLLNFETLNCIVSKKLSHNITNLIRTSAVDLQILVKISQILQAHPNCFPVSKDHQKFCLEIINRIACVNIPKPPNAILTFIQDVLSVANMILNIWKVSEKEILPCLSAIYVLIVCGSDSNSPSPCLAAILNVVPIPIVERVVAMLVNQTDLSSDSQVTQLGLVLCDWLILWPKGTNIKFWIVSLFKQLTLANRCSVVEDIILQKAPLLIERSIIPVMTIVTGPVLVYMLLTFQHSIENLQKILEPIKKLLHILKNQVDSLTVKFRTELGEALHILVERLPDNDLHYQQLTNLLSEIPKPSDQRQCQLKSTIPVLYCCKEQNDYNFSTWNNNWISCRSPTGKVGLINLGNTCYINCIIQALYMNQDFVHEVLEAIPSLHQIVLSKLQEVVAFLSNSFRPAYSPGEFIEESRPHWFESGRQQDCSEFLRYLLDTLYEQERSSRQVLECDERHTVHIPKKNVDNEELEEVADEGISNVPLKRWVTETDLSTSLNELDNDALIEPVIQTEAESSALSNVHSESTDSGIQSVGEGFQEDSRQLNARSLVHRVFGGKMTTTYRCLNCLTESIHQEFFTDLSLAFPGKSEQEQQHESLDAELNLDKLLDYYLATEKLEGENRYHCDHCASLQDAERTLKITEAPSHLLLTLLRFQYDRHSQRRGKISTRVSYQQMLKLPINDTEETYVLYAVVIHSGWTLDGGHYYTVARNSNVDAHDIEISKEPWFMFNDSQVSLTDFQTLIHLSQKYPTDTPYLLWYRKLSNPPAKTFPSLRWELKVKVDRDNSKFIQERSNKVLRQQQPSFNKKDDDDDRFHDDTMSRYVF